MGISRLSLVFLLLGASAGARTPQLPDIDDVHIGPAFALAENTSEQTRFYWHAGGGAIWDLADFFSLRLEFGWGSTKDVLRLGMIFWL